METSYDRISEEWTNIREQMPVNQCIVAFERLIKTNAKILDVGCGTGYPIDTYLSSKGHHITGIDISRKLLDVAKSRNLPNIKYLEVDFMEYQTSETFDAIIAFDSLWHIPYDQQHSIYTILANLLNDDGYLLFTHGIEDGEITGKMFEETFYYSALNQDEVTCLLEENHFKIIESYTHYEEETTGTRDWLVIAQKVKE